ncbi:hypothetical protein OG342_11385 [Streptomyces bobili]|nr:hypothetical protein [Streptomyces bobili]MCX5523458.1 hypothetical protein [Streptomyces bobili]
MTDIVVLCSTHTDLVACAEKAPQRGVNSDRSGTVESPSGTAS